jgi:hypothetical protein
VSHIPLHVPKIIDAHLHFRGDDVVVLDYKSVRSMYRNELLEYFEERAKLDG